MPIASLRPSLSRFGSARQPACCAVVGLLAMIAAGCGSTTESSAPPPIPVGTSTELPRSIAPSTLIDFATDGDAPLDEGTLWAITTAGRAAIDVRQLEISTAHAKTVSLVRLPAPSGAGDATLLAARRHPGTRPLAFDVARWSLGDPSEDLFTMRETPAGIRVLVRSLAQTRRVIAGGLARLAPPAAGVTRDVAVATWSGPRPDLFVIDRGSARERVTVTIFSGESRFKVPVLRVRVPFAGLDPARWDVTVARVSQPQPDLLLLAHDPRRRHAEVHVVDGESNFQRFAYERELALRPTIPVPSQLGFTVAGVESVFLADPRARRVQVFPLFQKPGRI